MTDPVTVEAPQQEIAANDSQLEGLGVTPELQRSCRECQLWRKVKEKIRVAELLENALGKLDERLKAPEFKPTIADYLKLIQLEKEFDEEEVKEIKVTWVAPAPSSKPDK